MARMRWQILLEASRGKTTIISGWQTKDRRAWALDRTAVFIELATSM